MVTLVAVVHVVVALLLIGVVLLQDPKGDAMGGLTGGSSSSNSLLGATGAATLLEKLTRWFAIFFSITCVILTVISVKQRTSVLDNYVPPAATKPGAATPAAPPTNAPANPAHPAGK